MPISATGRYGEGVTRIPKCRCFTVRTFSDFAGRLVLPGGHKRGEPFSLLPFQAEFVASAMAAGVHRAALTLPRGAGKSVLLGAVLAAHIHPDGPYHSDGAKIFIAASSRVQAEIVYQYMATMIVEAGLADISDRKVWGRRHSNTEVSLLHRPTEASVRVLSSDPSRWYGLAPTLVICDEPASWPARKAREMIAALTTALGKQPASRVVAIGTRSSDPNLWFSRWLAGESDYAMSLGLEPGEDWKAESTWHRCNPLLAENPHLLEAYRADFRAAENDPNERAAFLALRLNSGDVETVAATVLQPDAWAAVETEAPEPIRGGYVLAVDPSTVGWTGVAAFDPRTRTLDALSLIHI